MANKAMMVEALQTKNPDFSRKQAEEVYESLMEIITNELVSGNDVTLNGVGILKVATRKSRTGRNPKTGETLKIPSKKSVSFKASSIIKKALN